MGGLPVKILLSAVDIDPVTTKPSANIILAESLDNFDFYDVVIEYNGIATDTIRKNILADTEEQVFTAPIGLTTTGDTDIKFKLYRDSSLSMTAYYGRVVTNGTYANVAVGSGIANVTIYGGKL